MMKQLIEDRQRIERRIVRRVVLDLIAAEYRLNLDNGGETWELAEWSTDAKKVLAAMFATDEERLHCRKNENDRGWVFFVYGNDGPDVICDYTTNLEPILKNAEALAEKLEMGAA